DVLMKTDRASMLCSLEIRTAFLHGGLAELAGSIDTSLHLAGGGKRLVHEMLPADILAERSGRRYRKTAFRVPAAEWLRGPPAPGGIQQVVHRLAAEMGAFQTLVVALDDRDAATFDEAGELAVRRVRAGGWRGRPLAPRAVRMAALNAAGVGESIRFRPQLT